MPTVAPAPALADPVAQLPLAAMNTNLSVAVSPEPDTVKAVPTSAPAGIDDGENEIALLPIPSSTSSPPAPFTVLEKSPAPPKSTHRRYRPAAVLIGLTVCTPSAGSVPALALLNATVDEPATAALLGWH